MQHRRRDLPPVYENSKLPQIRKLLRLNLLGNNASAFSHPFERPTIHLRNMADSAFAPVTDIAHVLIIGVTILFLFRPAFFFLFERRSPRVTRFLRPRSFCRFVLVIIIESTGPSEREGGREAAGNCGTCQGIVNSFDNGIAAFWMPTKLGESSRRPSGERIHHHSRVSHRPNTFLGRMLLEGMAPAIRSLCKTRRST